MVMGFPHGSAGKESACNIGDPSLISVLRISAGEGTGYPLQYSWASLVAQLVKNPPAIWETWVQSLGWEDPLEQGKAIPSSILAWRIPWTVWSKGLQRVGRDWATFTSLELDFPGGSVVVTCLPVQEMWVRFLVWDDLLEKEMATHSGILAWGIPWTEGW